jgi:hypothetical protein
MRVRNAIVITALGFAVTSEAQPPPANETSAAKAPAKKATPAKKPERPPAIEPEAIAALEKMGAFLRDQKSFTVKTTSETDHALVSGQNIRLVQTGKLRVRRPDHLRADITSDRKQRQFFYDGRTFTMNAPAVGYYTSVPAPPTIVELAAQLEQRYGLELPLVDLFFWGTEKSAVDQIQMATVVGASKLDGVEVEQYAFRQPGLDWQIWIEKGSHPVPRKLVLTTTDVPTRPEYAVELAWDLDTPHDDSLFTFVPTKDSHQIALQEVPMRRATEARRTKTKRSR